MQYVQDPAEERETLMHVRWVGGSESYEGGVWGKNKGVEYALWRRLVFSAVSFTFLFSFLWCTTFVCILQVLLLYAFILFHVIRRIRH
jgi:hypothetical protein